ncbi:hypothetical protein CAPTEDRAFT_212678 [Capitella teleta]|uniref:G-protein coupled receptors family 1 profile domain-containing protein n=1 Tax=Capitella teleta TaxID=283909 RepID=R7TRW4_CAPTE|nr:hypothetical protein CAPTEDRAFT_212678 [Capitella teleta]|eukprot:ELT94241.1 hypothetical protein CAPTEDRAFT_212678 [Capitella teleta]
MNATAEPEVLEGDSFIMGTINPSASSYQIFFITLGYAQSIAVILINPMTIAALIKFRIVNKSRAHLFIINQCFVDVFLGCLHLLRFTGQTLKWRQHSTAVSIAFSWITSTFGCFLFLCSVSTAFVIGVDRAVATCKPMAYKRIMTHRFSVIAIIVIWITNTIVNFPAMLYQFIDVYSSGDIHYVTNPTEVYPPYYTTYFSGPLMMCLLVCNVLLYTLVLCGYIKAASKVNVSNSEQSTLRITRMCIITVTIFIFGMIPILTVGAVPPPESDKFHIYQLLYDIALMMCITPSYLNNIMYACLQRDIRTAYGRLFKDTRSQVTPSQIPDSRLVSVHSFEVHEPSTVIQQRGNPVSLDCRTFASTGVHFPFGCLFNFGTLKHLRLYGTGRHTTPLGEPLMKENADFNVYADGTQDANTLAFRVCGVMSFLIKFRKNHKQFFEVMLQEKSSYTVWADMWLPHISAESWIHEQQDRATCFDVGQAVVHEEMIYLGSLTEAILEGKISIAAQSGVTKAFIVDEPLERHASGSCLMVVHNYINIDYFDDVFFLNVCFVALKLSVILYRLRAFHWTLKCCPSAQQGRALRVTVHCDMQDINQWNQLSGE